MSQIRGAEPVIDEVIEKLQAGMPQRLAAINLEKGDDIVLLSPDDTSYFNGRVKDFPKAPAVFVMEGPSRYRQEGSHGLHANYDILVYVYDSDITGPRLARRLQRLVRAVIEVLYDDEPRERLSTAAYNLKPLRSVPGSVFDPDREHDWRGFYVIVFSVDQQEI